MLILCSREMVFLEFVREVKTVLCEVMCVPWDKISVALKLNELGKIVPHFGVNLDSVPGLTKGDVQDIIRKAYTERKGELEIRLKDLDRVNGQIE